MNTSRRLWSMLNSYQRRAALILLGLMLAGMLLETIGIGLVVPLLTLITEDNLADHYPVLRPLLESVGNPDHKNLVVIGMVSLVVIHGVKAVFLVFLTWQKEKFICDLQADLSQRLFAGYLRLPYTFHLQRNSAQLIRNTIGQVSEFSTVSHQGLILIAETLVLIGISSLLVMFEPIGALLVVSILGIAGWVFHRCTRSRILRWGEARQLHEGLRIQHLQQGLGGAKDVKLLGRENEFLSQYNRHNIGSAKVAQRQGTIAALPRLWLEFLAIIGLVILVLVMIMQGKPLEGLIPIMGLFAAAAFRLMPTISRIIGSIQSLRYTLPVIHTLHSELCLFSKVLQPSSKSTKLLPFRGAITLDRISYRYPCSEDMAIREISLSVPQGSSVGFIGGSGAGKSTLVDIILGLLTPLSGAIEIDGVNIQTNIRAWQNLIGYVPQTIYLTDDSLRRNIAFGLADDQIDDEAVWESVKAAQLDEYIGTLKEGIESKVGERGIRLSGGQRQRIGIARALYHDPPVLVLDEATSSLDTSTERGVMNAVRALQGDKTLIIVAHRLSTIEECDRLFKFEAGELVEEGSSAKVLRKQLDTRGIASNVD